MLWHLKRHTLWVLMAFLLVPAHAQKKGYSKGYIITNERERIEGQVKDRSSGTFFELYKRVRFKPEHTTFKRKYGPGDLLAYGYNSEHFESVPLLEESAFFKFRYYLHEGRERVFLKVISSGEDLTWFHWEYVDGESNYLDFIPLFYLSGSSEMVRVSQGVLGLKRARLGEYFRECPALVKALENKELKEIHEVYNFYLDHCGRK